jgi:hypothetical protein
LLTRRITARYREGATLDQLAVEFNRSESVIGRMLDAASVARRPPRAMPARHRWFDLVTIPVERQKEIADAYWLYPAHEVAGAYGVSIRVVERIADRFGVRKRAPNGYRRVPRSGADKETQVRSTPVMPTYRVTAVLDIELDAASLAEALALVGTPGTRVTVVQFRNVEAIQCSRP